MDNTPPNEKFLVNKSPDVQKVGVSKMKKTPLSFLEITSSHVRNVRKT